MLTPLPSGITGSTWNTMADRRILKNLDQLHRVESVPPTAIDCETPTRVMSAAEIAEALSC